MALCGWYPPNEQFQDVLSITTPDLPPTYFPGYLSSGLRKWSLPSPSALQTRDPASQATESARGRPWTYQPYHREGTTEAGDGLNNSPKHPSVCLFYSSVFPATVHLENT